MSIPDESMPFPCSAPKSDIIDFEGAMTNVLAGLTCEFVPADVTGTGIGMERRSGIAGDEELEECIDCKLVIGCEMDASEKDMFDFTRLGSALRPVLETGSSVLALGGGGEDPCTSPRPNPADE